jgi:tRNA(Ile)-lysidine synthase
MVVAVSGGADSMALLHALVRLREQADHAPLVIAHLNHQLRGADSDADAAFVQDISHGLQAEGVPHLEFRCETIDIAGRARAEGANLEALARRERYAWLTQLAREHHLPRVATGHTADDQAETVLFRLLRGTGLQGLRGIAPRRPLAQGIELVRPLLALTRADILDFLTDIGQPFREDRSNAELRFARNRIRHELLPLLARQYNPAIGAVLARLAEQAQELFRHVELHAESFLEKCELPRAGDAVILDRARLGQEMELKTAPRHLLRDMLRLIWQREGWPRDRVNFADWDRAAAVALGELTAADLPGGISIRCRERVVQIRRD